ncbi:MAG: Histone H1-like protein Hc1 [Blastocatellia bacterium]
MADEKPFNITTEERRAQDRRTGEDRRQADIGPPPGMSERRNGRDRRLFDRRAQGSTTGQLLIEVGRFAAENMTFRQKGNKAAARRARKHLSLIMKLAKQRRAEISAEIKGLAPGDTEAGDDADTDDNDE